MDEVKRKFVMLRTDDETKEIYRKAAKDAGHLSVSAWIRVLIHEAIKKINKGKIVLVLFLILGMKDSNASVNMEIIKEIEGGGCRSNASCIGDNGLAVSYWQLHKGVIDDYNRAFGTKYLAKIRENEERAKHIANWYMNKKIPAMLKYKNKPVTLESQLTAWNMGIGNAWKGKVATAYITKYKTIMEREGLNVGTAN